MDIQYMYEKKRQEFGRQCIFHDKSPEMLFDLHPDRKLANQWILQDLCDKETQEAPTWAAHELNTARADFKSNGMNHVEGGWPKDVNIYDEEATKRYRRKVEKEDAYPPIMMGLCREMEFNILQNNAVNIYQQYFDDLDPLPKNEKNNARVVNVYKDQATTPRLVNWISWSSDGQTKMAATHSETKFQTPLANSNLYIWDIESPNFPLQTLKPPGPTLCLEYSNKDPNLLISGQNNGQVAGWDLRKGNTAFAVSLREESFRAAVHSVLWINSKTGSEFFSCSADGQVKWWDTRNMNEATDVLILDLNVRDQHLCDALGASCLEYDTTIPTRYNVGTETGKVINCNRKGKNAAEIISAKYPAQFGPVLAVQRNSSFSKNFLTVGDWSVRIFAEECKETPLLWTKYHNTALNHACWSPTRPSIFFTARADGRLDVWDIIQDQNEQQLSFKITDYSINFLKCQEHGRNIACGTSDGNVILVQLSSGLATSTKTEKALLSALFEREAKREKIMEARNRELRLKARQVGSATEVKHVEEEATEWINADVIEAEREWQETVDKLTGVWVPPPDAPKAAAADYD